jgi:hypothetical protein
LAAGVDPKADVAEDQFDRWLRRDGSRSFEWGFRSANGNSRIDTRDGLAGVKFKRADMRRGGRWEHDVVCGVRGESVFTFVKPAEA